MIARASSGEFAARLDHYRKRVDAELARTLRSAAHVPPRLRSAMEYSVLGGGKRVRPLLAYASGELCGVAEEQLDVIAASIELVHAYSLVHDDLPAMDDDDLRRGRPTCHKAFDEATAILVGDALQVLAFETLASGPGLPADPAIRLELVRLLAIASGTNGMAGGQALDLAAVGRQLSLAEVEEMHARKTGALIHASVMMAAACSERTSESITRALDEFARAVGLAFQIQDDLLDIEGDATLLGKATGADRAHDKPTYPSSVGVDPARCRMNELHARALEALAVIGPRAATLASVSDWLVLRKY